MSKYHVSSSDQADNALREVMLEIALAGLNRGGFFKKLLFMAGLVCEFARIRRASGGCGIFSYSNELEPAINTCQLAVRLVRLKLHFRA